MMISSVILTHNNETNIESILTNLSWTDERIVVDDDSTDKTREVARTHGAVVVQHALADDFAAQRNIGLANATCDWILFVDTDETVSSELADEIQKKCAVMHAGIVGYYISRTDRMWGRELRYGETGAIKLLRLAKKGAGNWQRKVHEVWEVSGQTGTCTHPLLHSPHPDIRTFLAKINRYTTINAQVFHDEGKHVTVWDIILYPKAKFFRNYFIKRGFLDGTAGFVFAMMMAFHSFLTRAKMWQLQQPKSTDYV